MTRTTRTTSTLILIGLAACGGGSDGGYGSPTSPPPQGDGKTIVATPSLTFGPATLTVNAGDEVTFDFQSVPHNVFFDPQTGTPADIPGLSANVTVQRTFATAGTYRYTCHLHPGMEGRVIVR
jgi:plastocyanin